MDAGDGLLIRTQEAHSRAPCLGNERAPVTIMHGDDREKLFTALPECWEVKVCPTEVRDTCPAYPKMGRECWKITGTKCKGGAMEKKTLAEKIIHCRANCEYYRDYIKKVYP